MNRIRRQFLILLVAIVALFAAVVVVDLQFFSQAAQLYRLESKVAVLLLDWTSLRDRTSGLLLSNEPLGAAYSKWKQEYDGYRARKTVESLDLESLPNLEPLTSPIRSVTGSLNLGLEQMELVDRYLKYLVEGLQRSRPEVVAQESLTNLIELPLERTGLVPTDAFYLSVVRNAVHLVGNMMGPILDTTYARFQTQVAGRVSAITEQSSGVRLLLIALLLGVLMVFLLRVSKLNFDLMIMVKQRTAELEKVRGDQAREIAVQTEELRTANEALRRENHERRTAEALVVKLNRLYATLSNVNQSLVWIHDTERLLPEICRVSVHYGKFQLAWLGIVDLPNNRFEVYSNRADSGEQRQTITLEQVEQEDGPAAEVIRTGQPVIRNSLPTGHSLETWVAGVDRNYGSSATIPLYVKDQVAGLFGICSDEAGFFGQDDISLLSEMAKDISFALEFIEAEKRQQETEKVLHQWNEELERRVRERTRELEAKNEELDRLNRVFVGREVRMAELKQRIRELETKQATS